MSDNRASRRIFLTRGTIGVVAAGTALPGLAQTAVRVPNDASARPIRGISLRDFVTDGGQGDHSAAFARAVEAVQARSGGTLQVPAGTYPMNGTLNSRQVQLAGEGNTASVLQPSSVGRPILTAVDGDASWNTLHLADLGFDGNRKQGAVGLRLGQQNLSPHAEYTGRFLLSRLRFANLDRSIERPFGNIGFDIVDSTFQSADIHIVSKGQPLSRLANDPMHAGALTISRGSMQGARRAAIFIDGEQVAGAGQVVIDGVRFQDNPGWVLWIQNFNNRGPQPGVLVRSCWNEGNYTAPEVEMEGSKSAPGFARLVDVPVCSFEDTPIGPLALSASHVVTRGCNLDLLTAITMDAQSSITHHEARMFTGTARGLVRSIGHLENTEARTNLNTPWFPMPPPTAARGAHSHVLLASGAGQREQWRGQGKPAVVSEDNGASWQAFSDQILIDSGATLISPSAMTVPAGAAIVVQFVAKLVSGSPPRMNIDGQAGLGGIGEIREAYWRTYTAVWRNNGPEIANDAIYLRSGGRGPSILRIAGYAVTAWDNLQEALIFANSFALPSR